MFPGGTFSAAAYSRESNHGSALLLSSTSRSDNSGVANSRFGELAGIIAQTVINKDLRSSMRVVRSTTRTTRDILAQLAAPKRHQLVRFNQRRGQIGAADHVDAADSVASLLAMMLRIAVMDGPVNGEQQRLLDATERYFTEKKHPPGKWG